MSPQPLPQHPRLVLGLVVVGAALLACWPLWDDALPRGHDLLFELVRAAEFHRAVESGALRPRWATSMLGGYGYPIFNFFPPLLLSVTSALASLGLSLTTASKGALLVLAMLGALGSSLCGRFWWGQRGALLLPWLTAAAPYALHNLAVRSAWSEWSALQLAPLTLGSALWLTRQANLAWMLVFSAASALQICAHNLSLFLWLPVWLAGVAPGLQQSMRPRQALVRLVGGCALALGLSATFWLPLVREVGLVGLQWRPGGPFGVQANLLSPGQLALAEWRPMLVHAVLAGLAALGLVQLAPGQKRRWLGLLSALLVGWLLLLPASWPVWQMLGPLQLIMFPWRLLGPLGFVSALLLAGLALAPGRSQTQRLVGVLVAAGLALALTPSLERADLEPLAHNLPAVRRGFATTTVLDEYLPKTVQVQPDVPADQPAATGLTGATLDCTPPEVRDVRCTLTLPAPAEVVVRRLAFAGWQLALDGQPTEARISKRGTYVVSVPAGQHTLTATLTRTGPQQMGDAVSIAALLLWLGLGFLWLGLGLAGLAAWRRQRGDAITSSAPTPR